MDNPFAAGCFLPCTSAAQRFSHMVLLRRLQGLCKSFAYLQVQYSTFSVACTPLGPQLVGSFQEWAAKPGISQLANQPARHVLLDGPSEADLQRSNGCEVGCVFDSIMEREERWRWKLSPPVPTS